MCLMNTKYPIKEKKQEESFLISPEEGEMQNEKVFFDLDEEHTLLS